MDLDLLYKIFLSLGGLVFSTLIMVYLFPKFLNTMPKEDDHESP